MKPGPSSLTINPVPSSIDVRRTHAFCCRDQSCQMITSRGAASAHADSRLSVAVLMMNGATCSAGARASAPESGAACGCGMLPTCSNNGRSSSERPAKASSYSDWTPRAEITVRSALHSWCTCIEQSSHSRLTTKNDGTARTCARCGGQCIDPFAVAGTANKELVRHGPLHAVTHITTTLTLLFGSSHTYWAVISSMSSGPHRPKATSKGFRGVPSP